MTTEPRDDPFTDKMRKVRNVLVGEGLPDAEVGCEGEGGVVFFRASGAIPFKMRRHDFDAKTHFEIAFFVAPKMRRPPPEPARKPAAR